MRVKHMQEIAFPSQNDKLKASKIILVWDFKLLNKQNGRVITTQNLIFFQIFHNNPHGIFGT